MNYDRDYYIHQPVPIEKELKKLFNTKSNLIIFDIGACEGEDSIKYSRLFSNALIYSFEALPDNINLIRNNFVKYNVKNASYYNKALSCKNGITDFYVSSGRPENAVQSDWDYGNKSSSLLQPEKHLQHTSFIRFEKKIEVETITLKSFCDSNNIRSIDFIHMDVQGAELMVLEGAEELISTIKVIWLEVSKIDLYKNQPLVKDVKEFMEENHFVLLKDELNSVQGDQLYISKLHFSTLKIFFIKQLLSIKSLAAHLRSVLMK